ncbi:MAG: isocitrate lyase/PEP mutase family protein [Acidobacteriaceae bacterium]
MNTQDATARRAEFRRLHESGCFLIPNPWDIGSALYLHSLGYKALATTSAGFAFSRGLPDDERIVGRDVMLAHIAEIVAATELPVNADFQGGYAVEPEAVAHNVRFCAATGVAGLSIEDSTGNPAQPLFDLPLAIDRIRAAREALDGSGVLLTARAECFLVRHPDPLRESIRRLQAYAEAGADVLYAPGPTKREDIQAIVSAVAPKPVNILLGSNTGLSVADLTTLGVRRVSVGGAFARAAWTGFIRTAREFIEHGTLTSLDGTITHGELNNLFK